MNLYEVFLRFDEINLYLRVRVLAENQDIVRQHYTGRQWIVDSIKTLLSGTVVAMDIQHNSRQHQYNNNGGHCELGIDHFTRDQYRIVLRALDSTAVIPELREVPVEPKPKRILELQQRPTLLLRPFTSCKPSTGSMKYSPGRR